jgi:hypothetical protein
MTSARLAAVAVAALAFPGTALGGLASIHTAPVPAAAESIRAPGRFDLVGFRWRGDGAVEFRARSLAGRWSAWRGAAPEAEDAPDAATAEGRRTRGLHVGSPWWVGPSDRIEVRRRGRVTALRASFVRSPEVRVPLRQVAAAGAPPIVPRIGWGANESIRRAGPAYAPAIRFAVVHHTAGTNTYTRAQAAAVVRGIQLYHVQSNGWNDIGYNFLVDRFGTVYEGRYGGVDRNVVGAHAQGFNTGSVGVALLGTYGDAQPSTAAEKAIAELLAWRLDLAHVDPLSTLSFVSGGSERFPEGIPVFLRAVSGHRDTGLTECPGAKLYARLGAIAGQAQAIGLPKLYAASATGLVGGLVRFRAQVSSVLPWHIRVLDAGSAEVAGTTGTGKDIDWTWDATSAAPGTYRWEISTADSAAAATPATGVLGSVAGGATLAFEGAAADPEAITPNDDGQADTTTVTFEITQPASVGVSVVDEGGIEVATVETPRWRHAGEHVVVFDGLGLPDGRYALRLVARREGGVEVSTSVPVSVSRTLGSVAVAPATFSPNGDRRRDTLTVTFTLATDASVTVRILRDGKWVATAFDGMLGAGSRTVRWDGAKRLGRLRDGTYTAEVAATDAVATTHIGLGFASDTTGPLVRLLSRAPGRLWLSEPAGVTMRVNGVLRRVELGRPGALRIPGIRQVRTLVVVARDGAGNRTAFRPRIARKPAQ